MQTATALRRLGPVVLLLSVILWMLRDTAAAMVSIWIRSETFAHAFLVPPIVIWLIWRRRKQLATLPQRPVSWLLVPIAGACLLWLLGELATVSAASQFALVTLMVLSVPALFGWAVARALCFPLAFLYFALPIGEFMVPQLMDWTADFTVLALRATGIPVYREGLQFVIPSGNWSVVEACSGVRYLIASLMVGALFAHLNFTSTRRRVVFMLAALLVPVLANWLRAYMIVMIGHLSGNELAVGVDHLVYGWLFFGLVMGGMFVLGARWAEPDVASAEDRAPVGEAGFGRGGWIVVGGVLILLIGTQAWRSALDDTSGPPPVPVALPGGAQGWSTSTAPVPWVPGFRNPSAISEQAYDATGARVWLWVGFYRGQGNHRKLVSSVNDVVDTEAPDWSIVARGGRPAVGDLPRFRTATIRQGHALGSTPAPRLRVWQSYWVDGRWVTSDARAKLLQAFGRLLGRGDDGAVVLLVTALEENSDVVLEKFSRDYLGSVESALERARASR